MKKKRCNSWHRSHRCELNQGHKEAHINRPDPDHSIMWPRGGCRQPMGNASPSGIAAEIHKAVIVSVTEELKELKARIAALESHRESLPMPQNPRYSYGTIKTDMVIQNCDPILSVVMKKQDGSETVLKPWEFMILNRMESYHVRVEQPKTTPLPPAPQK